MDCNTMIRMITRLGMIAPVTIVAMLRMIALVTIILMISMFGVHIIYLKDHYHYSITRVKSTKVGLKEMEETKS